tara:strand:- start:27 stop:230 length:204 start_codon:yes stop_codon:yes gene_type:complete
MEKPINLLKNDLQSVIFKVERLHNNIDELRKDFKEMSNIIDNHLKECNKIDEELKKKLSKNNGWFWN